MSQWSFLAILTVLMALVAMGTVRSGLLLRDWTPRSNLLLSWPDNLLRLILLAACLALGLGFGPGPAAFGWATGSPGGDAALGLLSGLLLAAVLGVSGIVAVRLWGERIYRPRVLQCILPIDRREWLGLLPALAIAAALEEILFRWLPLAGLTWLVSPWWLLWPLAVFFGFLHWPQGWWGVAGTALAGIALALLFLATGSLWPALIAHYAMNVVQVVVAKLSGMEPARAAPGAGQEAGG